MTIIPILGLFESHLNVGNLDRSVGFYRDVLGSELAHRIPERHCASESDRALVGV
jgi:lactoylglutathione lyase